VLNFFFTSVKNTFSYKEQFLIKLASTKNVTFNVSCIKNKFYNEQKQVGKSNSQMVLSISFVCVICFTKRVRK
jgi:hypothetical protein